MFSNPLVNRRVYIVVESLSRNIKIALRKINIVNLLRFFISIVIAQ